VNEKPGSLAEPFLLAWSLLKLSWAAQLSKEEKKFSEQKKSLDKYCSV
jgi:hypothetical protein